MSAKIIRFNHLLLVSSGIAADCNVNADYLLDQRNATLRANQRERGSELILLSKSYSVNRSCLAEVPVDESQGKLQDPHSSYHSHPGE